MTRKWSWKEVWGDAMKAKVNLQLLNTVSFDSGSLGLLAMVIHQFSRPGYYRAVVMEHGNAVTEVDFTVDEKSIEMQLDIDLASIIHNAKARRREAGCEKPLVVSPKGYVLFYASSDSGYSVTVKNTDGNEEFDSTKLTAGDLFSLSLLEPAKYTMVNRLGDGEGEILVSLDPKMAKKIKSLETGYVNVSKKGFDPQYIELTSSQGLVFRVNDTARILVEKKEGETPRKLRKPEIRWRKPQMAK